MVQHTPHHEASSLSLSAALRSQTQEAHQHVESLPLSLAILDHSITLPTYVAQLHAWLLILRALEEAVEANPIAAAICQGWTHRSAWIAQDLHALDPHGALHNPSADQHAAQLATELLASDTASLLGALYVLEGSAMGGLVLKRHLAQALHLEEDKGLRYHAGHGPMSAPKWLAIKQRLDQASLSPQERERVIHAANHTFTSIGHIMRALL
jgi:heme oxygenase